MMDLDYTFDDIENMQAWWIPDSGTDAVDLARIADSMLDTGVSLISVPCNVTGEIWPWIEKNNIKIVNRFNFIVDKDADVIDVVSDFAKSVTMAFKSGAVGAQVFVGVKDIVAFCEAMKPIRLDLFFNKSFSVVIDIDEMRNNDWNIIFDSLREIHPDSVLIMAKGDSFDANSDFVGLVFDMLNKWNLDSDLQVWFGKNMFRVSQILRLCQKIQPKLIENMCVFINVISRASE